MVYYGKKGLGSGERLVLLSILFVLFFLLFRIPSATSWGPGTNSKNYSVRTTVNITSAYPEVLNVTCNGATSILLTGGASKNIACNVQLRDYDGGNTILSANATFYFRLNNSNDPDDNNTHYTNATCTENITSGFYSNWTCAFDMWYFANNGTWRLNVTIVDASSFVANRYLNITLSPLLALNVTDLIDFGNLAVTQTSSIVEANVTNLGNLQMNVTVYGFGGDNYTAGAGVAMLCDARNISFSNQRYSSNPLATYETMAPISGVATMIPGVTVVKQTQEGVLMVNSTYWALHVNMSDNPYGICNGTVVFSAELS